MRSLAGGTAVITGATSGIGRAIAKALARERAELHLVGRNPGVLEEAAAEARSLGGKARVHRADLATENGAASLSRELASSIDRLDLLVHSAGAIALARVEEATFDEWELQYRVNVAAPFLLTKALLTNLERARGQIVFINSSAGVRAKAGAALYGATKHALRALADGLRDEVNDQGIRVLSVYPGRTATPMQEALFRREGRPYVPGDLLQPEDVATVVMSALHLQENAEVTDIHIRGMRKVPPIRPTSPNRPGGEPRGTP
jgi:NADP-dependent 3-hydroxy acid dehydrogenase YdfG